MASYYVYSGAGGSNNGSSWANAFTTLTTAFVTEVAGDTLYVAHDHAESTAGAVTLTSSGTLPNPTKIVCVNRAGSVPPVSADRRTTAQVTTTGASSITMNGNAHYDGVIFSAGTGAVAASILVVQAQSTSHRFDNCSLRIAATSAASSTINLGAANNGGNYVEFNNTTISFGNVNQVLTPYARFKWRNTPSALLGSISGTLLSPGAGRGGSIECIGVDFSAAGSGKTIMTPLGVGQASTATFIDCKFDAAVTKSTAPTTHGGWDVDFIRTGASGLNYTIHRLRNTGSLIEETTIVRTGGANDGTTTIAWKIVTTDPTYSLPFECPPIAIWNDTTGSSVTATVEGIWGGGAVPNDDDVWLEVEYLGDASSPQGSFVNDGKADLLTTAAGQTSSSETWGGSTTKFKLAVSFTPQQKGWVYARVKCGKTSSTFYIDPLVTLT